MVECIVNTFYDVSCRSKNIKLLSHQALVQTPLYYSKPSNSNEGDPSNSNEGVIHCT